MVEYLYLILIIVWFPQAFRQVLLWTYWWQIKEYRFDRFKTLLSSKQGRKDLETEIILIKLFSIILSAILNFPIILFILYLILDLTSLNLFINRNIKKPVFTQRAFRMVATTFIIICIFLLTVVVSGNVFLFILIAEILLIVLPIVAIIWTIIFVKKAMNKDVKNALKVLADVNPYVIGVSGSYGKSTTKDFIADLLSSKYLVQETFGNENTLFGVARNIISNLKESTDYYVVEMGAYKRGDIKKLSALVKPKIGVLTGIEFQHLSLFGSIDDILSTKYELIESLPPGGTAIFNLNNKYCRDLYQRAKKEKPEIKVMGYLSNEEDSKIKADIQSKLLKITPWGLGFQVILEKKKKKIFAPVHGIHFIENISAAILVARLRDVSWEEIAKACKNLKLPPKTLELKINDKGVSIIDDSYNLSSSGFDAALKYLSLFKASRKIIITPGIIELGEMTASIHRDLGKKIAKVGIEKLLVTSVDFYNLFSSIKGLEDRVELVRNIDDANKALKDLNNNYTVLIEGRVPIFITTSLGII